MIAWELNMIETGGLVAFRRFHQADEHLVVETFIDHRVDNDESAPSVVGGEHRRVER